MEKSSRTLGVIFDPHHPFCNRRAYDLTLSVFKYFGITDLILGGDFLDMHNVSRHDKNLDIEETLQDEIEAGIDELALLKTTFPKSRKVYLFGNHESRLDRYIAKNCAELWQMFSLKKILCAELLGFEVIDYGPGPEHAKMIADYLIRHDFSGTIATAAQRAGCNIIYGHSHKAGHSTFTGMTGETIHAINGGMLCDIKSPAFSYVQDHHKWQLSFVIGWVHNGILTPELVMIYKTGKKYWCSVGSKIFTN